MAKKAFEIQGSDLSLGGVNLQAGTNGVVIPGITQATNYFVEEVDDTSVDQTTTIENTPLVIDAVSYNVLLGDANASIATYSSYTVELEDDFYIDEITVASRGTYTEQEKTMNETTDMWAYGGAVSADAFTPFVSTDWFQVPFRPKMRADEVTTIGGGGSGSRVKLESPGDRRIEEVYGYKEVSVTERNYGPTIETTVSFDNTGNEWQFYMPSTQELLDLMNGATQYSLLVSGDSINWYSAYIGGNGDGTVQIVINNGLLLAFSQGQPVYYQVITGADPVVWWDKAELPGDSTDFRGAIIDYHAYTGESTIIGTIHIVDDSGEEHISHTEVQSGSTDGENDDLWLVTQEGQIKYRRIDGEGKTLKVQWSAKVFYGSEFWD
jgi:hypothetical protein